MPIRNRLNLPVKMSFKSLYLNGEFPPFFGFVLEGKLAGSGAFDADESVRELQVENLRNKGIAGVISLTEEAAGVEGVEHLHLPTEDLTPPSLQQLADGCRFIEEVNGGVLVHCKEGVGRTGTLLAAYLMWRNGLSAEKACEEVRSKRSASIHKKCQEEQLHRFGKILANPRLRASLADGTFIEAHHDFSDCILDVSTPKSPLCNIGIPMLSPIDACSSISTPRQLSNFPLESAILTPLSTNLETP